MKNKKKSVLISLGFSIIFFAGCGNGSTTNIMQGTNQSLNENDNLDINTSNNNNPVVPGYTAGNGILIETRSDGTKRAWVNNTTTACLIYRLSQHPGTTILDGGRAHCKNLNSLEYGGITTWRMPDEDEAVYLMSHVSVTGKDRIIYPDDNPNCQFMVTTNSVDGSEGRFVYTTNNPATGAFNNFDVQGKIRTTAGIRCVADQ